MTNHFEKWLGAGAEFMHKTRPDLWTYNEARAKLHRWYLDLTDPEKDFESIGSGGFRLQAVITEGTVMDYELVLHVADYSIWNDEVTDSFIWTKEIENVKGKNL